MKSFNLSEWALNHRAVVLFLILVIAVAGVLSSTTALAWGLLNWRGRLPEPASEGIDRDEVEVHGEPTV